MVQGAGVPGDPTPRSANTAPLSGRSMNFPEEGAPTPKKVKRQHIILVHFFYKNCMKIKKFGPPMRDVQPWIYHIIAFDVGTVLPWLYWRTRTDSTSNNIKE